MSPNQYAALRRLVEADWIGVKVGDVNNAYTVHHATAEALERRRLAVVIREGLHAPYAKATTAAVELLRDNPEPIR